MPTRQGTRSIKKNQMLLEQQLREAHAQGVRWYTEFRIDGKLPLVRGRRFKRNPQPVTITHTNGKTVTYPALGKRGWYIFTEAVKSANGNITIECSGPYTKAGTARGAGSHSITINEIGTVERSTPRATSDIPTKAERAAALGLGTEA